MCFIKDYYYVLHSTLYICYLSLFRIRCYDIAFQLGNLSIYKGTLYICICMYALLWICEYCTHIHFHWIEFCKIYTHTYSHTSINNSPALQSNSQKQSINRERAQKTYAIPEERRRSLYILRSTVRHQSPPHHTHSFVYVKRRLWSLLGHILFWYMFILYVYICTQVVWYSEYLVVI